MADTLPISERITVEIEAIISETPDIKRFVLKSVTGDALPHFTGGSHIVFYLNEVACGWHNAYSLLSSPDDLSCYEVAVLLESQGKGGSKYLHQQSQVGDRLQISPPQNYFPLVNMASRPQHLIAGGIGITPFLAQRFELAAGAADWQLHYLAKQPEQMAFYSQLSESPDTKHLHFYFSQAGSPFSVDKLLSSVPANSEIYVCGPNRLIDAVLQVGKSLGFPESQLHFEPFAELDVSGQNFTVVLQKSGITLDIPANSSILAEIEHHTDVCVESVCRNGFCGTCETAVLDGEVDHLDHYLDDDEKAQQNTMMICVSRSKGNKLILDL